MDKLLVTGCSGQLGKKLMTELADSYSVLGIDKILGEHCSSNIQLVDIRHFGDVYRAMDGVKYVVHTAALHGIDVVSKSRNDFYETNIDGTINVLEAAVANNVEKLIFMSTTSVYGSTNDNKSGKSWWLDENADINTKDINSHTKYINEKICEYYAENTALSVIILRSAKFYESPNYVQNIIDYSYKGVNIEDLIQAIKLSLKKKCVYDLYNIASSTPFLSLDCEKLFYNPREVFKVRLPELYSYCKENKIKLPESIRKVVCIDKAKKELGFYPKHTVEEIMHVC